MKYFSLFTDDYKDFGTNCESMAAEIEDHILQFSLLFAVLTCSSFIDDQHASFNIISMIRSPLTARRTYLPGDKGHRYEI